MSKNPIANSPWAIPEGPGLVDVEVQPGVEPVQPIVPMRPVGNPNYQAFSNVPSAGGLSRGPDPFSAPRNPDHFMSTMERMVRAVEKLDITSGRTRGLVGNVVEIVPATSEIIEEIVRVEESAQNPKPEVISFMCDINPLVGQTNTAHATGRLRYGSGNYQTSVEFDWVQGIVLSVVASSAYLDVIVPATTDEAAPSAARFGAWAGRMVSRSKTPVVRSVHYDNLTPDGGEATFAVPARATGVWMYRDEPQFTDVLVEFQSAAATMGSSYFSAGQNCVSFLPLHQRVTNIRVINESPPGQPTIDVRLVYELAL